MDNGDPGQDFICINNLIHEHEENDGFWLISTNRYHHIKTDRNRGHGFQVCILGQYVQPVAGVHVESKTKTHCNISGQCYLDKQKLERFWCQHLGCLSTDSCMHLQISVYSLLDNLYLCLTVSHF